MMHLLILFFIFNYKFYLVSPVFRIRIRLDLVFLDLCGGMRIRISCNEIDEMHFLTVQKPQVKIFF
jgi:hypothetical protein